jgi:hypothetical protein
VFDSEGHWCDTKPLVIGPKSHPPKKKGG